METQICVRCEEELPIEEFYYYKTTDKYFTKCKTCTMELRKNNIRTGIENCDRSIWVLTNKPGDFPNDIQKKAVYQLLESIGWIHNPDKNLWFKKGIRDANGNWKNIKPKVKRKRVRSNKEKRVFDVEQMKRLRAEGYKFIEIGEIMGWSKPTVIKNWYKNEESS